MKTKKMIRRLREDAENLYKVGQLRAADSLIEAAHALEGVAPKKKSKPPSGIVFEALDRTFLASEFFEHVANQPFIVESEEFGPIADTIRDILSKFYVAIGNHAMRNYPEEYEAHGHD